jgi:hypothetical protein
MLQDRQTFAFRPATETALLAPFTERKAILWFARFWHEIRVNR